MSFVCDGIQSELDCSDGSDEDDCYHCKERSMHPGLYHLLPMKNVCDGMTHCSDGSDEENCGVYNCLDNGHNCSVCKNFKKDPSYFINKRDLCDGVDHCSDGADEEECETCQGFLCDNGECIPSWLRCSGKAFGHCNQYQIRLEK